MLTYSAHVVSTEAQFTPIPAAALNDNVVSLFTFTLKPTSDNFEYSIRDDLQPIDFVFTRD